MTFRSELVALIGLMFVGGYLMYLALGARASGAW